MADDFSVYLLQGYPMAKRYNTDPIPNGQIWLLIFLLAIPLLLRFKA
jgi:hypothetical protein